MVRAVTESDIGIRVLVDPTVEASKKHSVDIIAIHGLGAHPDDTWTKKRRDQCGDRWINWLSEPDMLPRLIPEARIIRYGYHSDWFGSDSIRRNVRDIAENFLLCVQDAEIVARNKPVILVAHSFGGLVALKAVSLAYHHPEGWPGIFECFAGIHFFGTPFRGAPGLSYSETLGAAYEVLEPDLVEPRMLEILQRGNETLTELVDDFCRIWSHHRSGRIACFYELHASEVGNIVGEVEGCLDLWRGVSKHALAKNHFNMNKFASPDESEFRLIGRIMKETVQNAMPPQLPPRRTSANTDSTNLGTAENPATQSQSTLDRLWLLNFPNAKVSKVCYECKRDSRPKEDLWLPCPLHCSDCPRSTDMNWREALKGKSLLSLTGFEDLCIVHQEAKKHIERQKRERKELERLIALQAPRPAPIYNAGGFSQAYQSQRTNDLLRDIKRNQDQARLVPSLQGSHLRPSRNANASSPKPFTFGGGSGLSGSTPQVLARTYSPQTQAQQFSNMLDRYNTLHQQTMMENMEMQKAQAFWNPLDSMSKRGATS